MMRFMLARLHLISTLATALAFVVLVQAGGVGVASSPDGPNVKRLTSGPAEISRVAALQCTDDQYYTVQSEGQVTRFTVGQGVGTGTQVATGWARQLSGGTINGLGVSGDGGFLYAFERAAGTTTQGLLQILIYNANTGVGTRGPTVDLTMGGGLARANNMVGGTVDPITGDYYFGGTDGTNANFYIYRYNVSTAPVGAVSYVGYVAVAGQTTAGNGDFAFDAAGNFYAVYSQTVLGTVQNRLVSVDRARLLNPVAGVIVANASQPGFTTAENMVFNGIALLASGNLLVEGTVSNSTVTMAVDPSTGAVIPNSKATIFNAATPANTGTDLASCVFPPTIQLKKNLVGARAASTDQFTMDIVRVGTNGAADSVVSTATTSGQATGLQAAIAGPALMGVGQTYIIREQNPPNPDRYLSTYQCFWGADPAAPTAGNVTGTLTSVGNYRQATLAVTPGDRGGQVRTCIITNTSAAPANFQIEKKILNASGTTTTQGLNWALNASAAGTGVTQSPTATAQTTTQASPVLNWTVNFDRRDQIATVQVGETNQPGYKFATATCTITHTTGSPVVVTWTDTPTRTLTNILPGDNVQCVVTNQQLPGVVTWTKTTPEGTALAGSVWKLSRTGSPDVTIADCTAAPCTGADKDPVAGQFRLDSLDWGTYTLTETTAPAGYVLDATPRSFVIDGTTANPAPAVSLGAIANQRILGTATWRKVANDAAATPLAGSEWTLTGPGIPAGTVVTDCLTAPCPAGSGKDQSPTPGTFNLPQLAWGTYTLTETKAPAGYVLDTTVRTFTIGPANLNQTYPAAFVNVQRDPVTLPLTGGTGSDTYRLLGGGIIALVLLTAGFFWRRHLLSARRKTGS